VVDHNPSTRVSDATAATFSVKCTNLILFDEALLLPVPIDRLESVVTSAARGLCEAVVLLTWRSLRKLFPPQFLLFLA